MTSSKLINENVAAIIWPNAVVRAGSSDATIRYMYTLGTSTTHRKRFQNTTNKSTISTNILTGIRLFGFIQNEKENTCPSSTPGAASTFIITRNDEVGRCSDLKYSILSLCQCVTSLTTVHFPFPFLMRALSDLSVLCENIIRR